MQDKKNTTVQQKKSDDDWEKKRKYRFIYQKGTLEIIASIVCPIAS